MCQIAGEALFRQAGMVVHFLGWEHRLSPHPAWEGGCEQVTTGGMFPGTMGHH